MPIILDVPRLAITQMVKDEVLDFVNNEAFEGLTFLPPITKPLSLIVPHKIYQIGLEKVGEPNFLALGSLIGWRYLIQAGKEVIASAEWSDSKKDGIGSASGFAQSSFNASTKTAIEIAERSPKIRSEEYEIHLLRVIPMFVMALWLKHSSGDRSRDIYSARSCLGSVDSTYFDDPGGFRASAHHHEIKACATSPSGYATSMILTQALSMRSAL